MDADSELRLSYYEKVADIDARHDVALVKNIEDGRFYVRKKLINYDRGVLDALKTGRFKGVPRIVDVIGGAPASADNSSDKPDVSGHSMISKNDRNSGELILIEEFINGRTLAEIGDAKEDSQGKKFSDEETAGILLALCSILEPLHKNDPPIIHRDIKPSNVMITDEGQVYLIDFDAGKMYSAGKDRDTVLMGTKGYAAPEQYGFGQSDARTDIYLLGSLAEALLDPGEEIFEEDNALHEIIVKCKALDPKDRYQSVIELSDAINGCGFVKGARRSDESTYKKNIDDRKNYSMRTDRCSDSWLLPGFRLHDPKRMIGGLLWYAFIIYYAFMPLTKEDIAGYFGRIDHIFAALAMLLCTLFVGNFRGIADRFPLTKSDVLWKRITGYVLYSFLMILMCAAVSLIFADR